VAHRANLRRSRWKRIEESAVAPRNSLIALLAAVLLIVVVVWSVGRRTTSEADNEPRSAPGAGGPAAPITPPPGTSPDAGATTDASGTAQGGLPGPAGAYGQALLPPEHGDPAATDLYPTSTWPDLPDPAAAGPSTDPYPTSVAPEDLAPGDATPAADPFPTSLPYDPPDPGTPTDPAQRPQDAHPTEEQSSPTG